MSNQDPFANLPVRPDPRAALKRRAIEGLEEAKQFLRERYEAHKRRKQGGDPPKQNAKRGYNMNTLRNGWWMFGFLSKAEGMDGGPWYLSFDCVDMAWMMAVWNQMQNVTNAQGTTYQNVVLQFLNNQPFDTAFANANAAAKRELTEVYLWFVDLLVNDDHGFPRQGTFECYVNAAWRHIGVPVVDSWYVMALVEREDDQNENNGIFIEHLEVAPYEQASLADLGFLQQAIEPIQGILRALNYPNVEPPGGGGGDGDGADDQNGPPDEGGEMLVEQFGARRRATQPFEPVALLLRSARAWLENAARAFVAMFRWPSGLAPAFALPGGGSVPWQGREPEHDPPVPRHAQAYCGSANPNPMVGGAQSFVAVMNVGQGNLNMIVGANQAILAYYDFGFTLKPANAPAPHFPPCFCGEPTIILSHWDKDHYGMASRVPRCYGMRWIVPQQKNSARGSSIHGHVRKAGGRFCIWRDGLGGSHMRFDWGFLERCTAPGGTNGSGLAAFICVRDTNEAYVGAGGGPLVNGVQDVGVGAEPTRARAAVAQVGAAIANAGAGGVAGLPALASALAAGLGASADGRRIEGAGGNWALAIAAAAVAAGGQAIANPGWNAAQILAGIAGQAMPGHSIPQAAAARVTLADAAHGARGAATLDARADAVAQAYAAAAQQRTFATMVRTAVQAPPAAPDVYGGAGPAHANEGFVLLNGDANFNWVPATGAVPPRVVALTAMHHGSMLEDGELLDADRIPWAPGATADAAHHASQAAAHIHEQAAEAAATGNAGVLLATTRAAAAATAAIHAVAAVGNNGNVITTSQRIGIAYAAAAAAAAIVAQRGINDGKLAGIAAVVAAIVEPGIAPVGVVVDKLVGLLNGARNIGPRTLADVQATGLFTTAGTAGVLAIVNAAGAANNLTAGNASAAATAVAPHVVDQHPTHTPVLSAVAAAAVVAHANGHAVNQVNMVATVAGGHAAAVGNALNAGPMVAWPANVGEVGRWAARFAAVSAASNAAGVSASLVDAAIVAVAKGTAARATAVRAAPAGAQIAYSYGVTNAGVTSYRAATLGGLGHAHPLAIASYEARGWTQRTNTSHNAHVGPQADNVNPHGHAALGWDNANNNALGRGQINHQCPTCGAALVLEC